MPQAKHDVIGEMVLIALGGNAPSDAGSPQKTLEHALLCLTDAFGILAVSRYYQTPSFPAGSGPDFVNAACMFHSQLPPDEILETLHQTEAAFGRKRDLRWGQRTLDLDLIAYGGLILPDAVTFSHWRTLPLDQQKVDAPNELILPHPRVQDRAFVLVPLLDVAPTWAHPVLGLTVAEMLEALPDHARAEIKAL